MNPIESAFPDLSEVSTCGYINGHEYVDLGLSVKWATCNVGASFPSDCGDHFAWGEPEPKAEYNVENSMTYEKQLACIAGDPQYDAARANWGGTWRLPTKNEMDELLNKCERKWATQDGYKGYRIIGPNGNCIFLPAAGWRRGVPLLNSGEQGYYWSGDPQIGGWANTAFYIYFTEGEFTPYWFDRYYGGSVRPVSE